MARYHKAAKRAGTQDFRAIRRKTHQIEYDAMVGGSKPIQSTRTGKPGTDAHRDMDGFDPDEELRRMILATARGKYKLAATMAHNLDENMQRGGPPPVAWLGPRCMREKGDRDFRFHEATEREKIVGYRNDYC